MNSSILNLRKLTPEQIFQKFLHSFKNGELLDRGILDAFLLWDLVNVYSCTMYIHVTDIKCGINCQNGCFKVLKYKISQCLGFAFQCMQMQNNVLQLLSQFLSNFQDSTVL